MGFDFRYRNSRLPGGRDLRAEFWYQKSDTDGLSGDDAAWGVGVAMPNSNKWKGFARYREIQQNFNPALGFVNQRGIRDYKAELAYTHRPRESYLRTIVGGVEYRRVERIAGGLDERTININVFRLENNSSDTFQVRYVDKKESLIAPFEISPGVIIPPGNYSYKRAGLDLDTGRQRPFSADFRFFAGEYYDGDRLNLDLKLEWRPSKHFSIEGRYAYNDIELPYGDFITRLMIVESEVAFSSQWAWVSLLQYDNVSRNFGIHSRLHWNRRSGQDLYFVVDHNFVEEDNRFRSVSSELTLKVSYVFRF